MIPNWFRTLRTWYTARRTAVRTPRHEHRFSTLIDFRGGGTAVREPFTVEACPDCRQLRFVPYAAFMRTPTAWQRQLRAYLVTQGYGLHVDAAMRDEEPSESVAREARP